MSQLAPDQLIRLPGAEQPVRLRFDMGGAYELFVSLAVLHEPERFDLRASWAAGVRSRLPAVERKCLEDSIPSIWVPYHLIDSLPEPKDAATLIWALRQLPAAERLAALVPCEEHPEFCEILKRISARGAYDQADLEALKAVKGEKHLYTTKEQKQHLKFVDWWTRPAEFGELFLSALQSYYQAFFADEEERLIPYLRQGLEKAQELAARLDLPDLLAELSQGVHFDEPFDVDEILLAPSIWCTPLILWGHLPGRRMIFMYGARPADVSLVAGESVPDGLLHVLKAIADPTRLRILRFLAHEKLTQAQIARRLRLRAPTITHHLNALRLAGLVHLTLGVDEERLYSARLEAIQSAMAQLEDYLQTSKES
jgi:DNA-binding transcriptional ArsR family regulator